MKRKKYMLCWLSFTLLALGFTPCFGQANYDTAEQLQEKPHTRLLKIHPLQLGEVYMSYEKMRTDRISNEIGFGYVYRSYFKEHKTVSDGVGVTGFHLRMSQQYYTSKKYDGVPLGFFHGPLFGYRFTLFGEDAFSTDEQNIQQGSTERIYQNALELNYQIGGQFKVGQNLTVEIAAAIGGRMKYVRAKNADHLITDNVIGHAIVAEKNSAILITPSPQLDFSLGYSF